MQSLILLVFVLLAVCYAEPAAPSAPNLLITSERIQIINDRLKAGDPVVSEAVRQLKADADSYLRQTPNPISGELKVPGFYKKPEEHRKIVGRVMHDAAAANCLALAFAVSGDRKYGLKSKEYLFAWVQNLGQPRDAGTFLDIFTLDQRGDTPLVITYTFPNFIYAFDVLDGLGMLSEEERTAFRTWLRIYVDYCKDECLIKNNHYNWQSLFLMCSGIVLHDQSVFDRGVKYYKRGFRIQVLKDGALLLELWREEKCATYSLMALEAMLQGTYIASKHGHPEVLELRSEEKGSLKNAVDCLVSFLDDPDNWQTKRRKKYAGFKKQNRPEDTSDWGWILELPYAWWKDGKYLNYMKKRPYGDAVRTYSMGYSTLLFGE